MKQFKKALLGAASITILVAVSSAAGAQTTAPDATPKKAADQGTTVGQVVITGQRASMREAITAKRASSEIVETISSKDIGVLPDVTIADELNRLPGINTTRDRGNDSQAAVRGLGPRLVLGLVDGREVASSEPDRNVRWEIYPSEDVSSVTVYKSQSANLIAGGVAATVDIRTLRPLDYSGPSFVARIGPQYNSGGVGIPNYSPWGLRGSAEYIAKINDDFGLAFGGTYQQQKNGYVSFQGWGYNTPYTGSPPTLNGAVTNTPWGAQTEVDGLTETRESFSTAAQWKPGNNLDVNFDFLYSDVKIDEYQEQAWYGSGVWDDWAGNNANSWDPYNSANGSFTVANGDVVGATLSGPGSWERTGVNNVIAHYMEDKSLIATGVNAAWTTDVWKVRGDLSFSTAERSDTWQAVESSLATPLPSSSFYTGANGAPWVTMVGNPADPTAQVAASGESDGPEHLEDSLGAAQLDFARTLNNYSLTELDFGARYSYRIKSDSVDEYYPSPIVGNIPSSLLSNFTVKGLNVPTMLYGNFDQLAQAVYGGYSNALALFQPADYWKVQEQDGEAYFLAKFADNVGNVPMTGNAGVRLVSVATNSFGYQQVNGGSWVPDTGSNHYTDVLPSLNLNFNLTDDTKLRFGLARVMSRPPLDELRDGQSLYNSSPPPTGSAGNPKLNPFLANQADLSYEWYFHPEALFAAAIYYKDVDTNIGYKTDTVDIGGTNYLITGPFNGKGGYMDGVEFTFQTPFYFIPNMEHFGIYSNLALAGSNIKEFSPPTNPLPMVGLANTTYDVSLWYSQFGVDARLDYKYHSPFTVIYGWNASQLTRLDSEGVLGASISYQLTHNMTVRLQANNLTNQISRYYWNNDPQQLARYDNYGRSYLLDFAVKY